MSKKEATVVHTVLVGDQGTAFGEGDLEETHMEKEKKCGIMKRQKILIVLYFYFCQLMDKKLY